jgi:hypothetical protein
VEELMRSKRIVALVCCFLAGVVSHAGATTITFNSLVGANFDTYLGHSESGFTVTPTVGSWFEAHLSGDPIPDIFGTTATASVDVTGGLFTFSSVELENAGPCTVCATFSITGSRLGVSQFNFAGVTTNAFVAYSNGAPATVIDRLTIAMTKGFVSYNIDNIVVNASSPAVPEPASLLLLGTGGLAVLRRRRQQS